MLDHLGLETERERSRKISPDQMSEVILSVAKNLVTRMSSWVQRRISRYKGHPERSEGSRATRVILSEAKDLELQGSF